MRIEGCDEPILCREVLNPSARAARIVLQGLHETPGERVDCREGDVAVSLLNNCAWGVYNADAYENRGWCGAAPAATRHAPARERKHRPTDAASPSCARDASPRWHRALLTLGPRRATTRRCCSEYSIARFTGRLVHSIDPPMMQSIEGSRRWPSTVSEYSAMMAPDAT